MGLKSALNSPFDYYEKTTLYLENKDVKRPSLKAYLYNKSVKNDLDKKIIRFEISIRNIKNEDNTYEVTIKHLSLCSLQRLPTHC